MVDYPIVYQTTSGLSIGQRIDKPMDFGVPIYLRQVHWAYILFLQLSNGKKQLYILQRRRVWVWFTWESNH